MLRPIAAILIYSLSMCALPAIGIESAYSRYYEDGDIRTISQYFGAALGRQGFRSVVASNPEAAEGQYFIARLENTGTGVVSSARMQYLPSNQNRMSVQSWDLSGVDLKKWLYLGLTGDDWPDPDVKPLAWRIELLDADGNILAEWKSFLWEMP